MTNWPEQFDKKFPAFSKAMGMIWIDEHDYLNLKDFIQSLLDEKEVELYEKWYKILQENLDQQKKESLDKYSIAIQRWCKQHGEYGPGAADLEALKQSL